MRPPVSGRSKNWFRLVEASSETGSILNKIVNARVSGFHTQAAASIFFEWFKKETLWVSTSRSDAPKIDSLETT